MGQPGDQRRLQRDGHETHGANADQADEPVEADHRVTDATRIRRALPTLHDQYGISVDAVVASVKGWF